MRNTFVLLITLSFILACAGCWGTPITPAYNYEKCPFEGGTVRTLDVIATSPWQETGILVEVGDELFFKAEGEWSLADQQHKNSPAGRMGMNNLLVPIIPDAP